MTTRRTTYAMTLLVALIAALTAGWATAGPAAAANKPIVYGNFVLEARNGEGECLTAVGGRQLGLRACNGGGVLYEAIPYNDAGVFQMKNHATGLCLDSGGARPGGGDTTAYESPCDRQDGGQAYLYRCDGGQLMNMASTYFITWWNANTVSSTGQHRDLGAKTTWTMHPRSLACT